MPLPSGLLRSSRVETRQWSSPDTHRARCDDLRGDVQAAFSASVGRPVMVRLLDERNADPDEHIDLTELQDAPAAGTLIDQLTTAFPGAEIIEE